MALDPQGAVYSRLIGDNALTALLQTYTPPGGSAGPSIFSTALPNGYDFGPKPSIIIDKPIGNVSDDTYSEDYRDLTIRVRLFATLDGPSGDLNTAAEAARARLKSWAVETINGADYQALDVFGPEDAPSGEPGIDGLLVTARLYIKEA